MADSKVSALTADTSVDSADLGLTVEDPSGTPVSKKATWLNILKGAALGVLTSDGDLFTRASGALTRITRASLAADSAFSSLYAPLNGAGSILGVTQYDPGTIAVYTTTSSTNADADSTNLSCPFTAPPSGKVLVRLEAVGNSGNSATQMFWQLRSGSSDVGPDAQIVSVADNSRHTATMLVTGLTPGASLTYKWGFFRSSGGTGTCTFYAGGVAGPASIMVWASP